MANDKTCCVLLGDEPCELGPPPYGRYIERIVSNGRVDLTKGGPFGMLHYERQKFERITETPWKWRLIERRDISEDMLRSRLRFLADILKDIG